MNDNNILDSNKLENVFDDKKEYDKFYAIISKAIQEFASYREGRLTYGEVMFVLESILDDMRRSSENRAKIHKIENMKDAPTFTSVMQMSAKLLEVLNSKELISSDDLNYILDSEK